ncbi:unnamed protein product [Medioppia subpectinata]|uniref:Beta-glucuronidase n=1 Tax=Medioppia subpectinata TaxID=1979941 RepID=A0A7R9PV39_9ACAR|nr:unnamed protein product [Medioppia subpectinata]CAG2101464.1 unnamed protein product [Medioppia subpectinata]
MAQYYGWYSDTGYTQVIDLQLTTNLRQWHKTFAKPLMISEFESEFMMEYHKSFDKLIAEGYFVGEHIWNFADFMTHQNQGNSGAGLMIGKWKGKFTQSRCPCVAVPLQAGEASISCLGLRWYNLIS